jgi:hypothetical protein
MLLFTGDLSRSWGSHTGMGCLLVDADSQGNESDLISIRSRFE